MESIFFRIEVLSPPLRSTFTFWGARAWSDGIDYSCVAYPRPMVLGRGAPFTVSILPQPQRRNTLARRRDFVMRSVHPANALYTTNQIDRVIKSLSLL